MKRGATTNLFNKGLVMDLNPILTPNDVLTDALNATIITNNGNEMVLQNDMGNGRVGTAFLPEGYIPVGSCEFGDIIYIASYNPLINKCLLGCFPSPQRYKVNDKETDLKLKLSYTEFQDTVGTGDNEKLTGKLKLTTLKKIIYENNLQSGDKYIISAVGIAQDNNLLTDLGNTDHEIGKFPRLYKITVVSIEEDGKITKLTDGVKWYNNSLNNDNLRDYYLSNKSISSKDSEKIDLDSYRSAVTSAYCIFSSKISGKLALLIELESITGFSCTWGVSKTEEIYISSGVIGTISLKFPIYFSLNWDTDNNNINPSGLVLLESDWAIGTFPKINYYAGTDISNNIITRTLDVNFELPKIIWKNEDYWETTISRSYKPEIGAITYNDFKDTYCYEKQSKIYGTINTLYFDKFVENADYSQYYVNYDTTKTLKENESNIKTIPDDVVNNSIKYPVKKQFNTFILPIKQEVIDKSISESIDLDLTECKYKYKIAPCMPYGVLEQYALEGIIDFSKIGKKSIKLNTWKYYNQEGYSTLTYGFEAYTAPEKVISKVVIEFYDDKGFVAAKHITNRDSFNGVFTDYIVFNGINYGFSNVDADGKEQEHVSDIEVNENDLGAIQVGDKYYLNDVGLLQRNKLYLAKIVVFYSDLTPLREPDMSNPEKINFYRWYWTTNQFNDLYFQLNDFDYAQFTLDLFGLVNYSLTDNWSKDWKVETEGTSENDSDKELYNKSPEDFLDKKIEFSEDGVPDSLSYTKSSIKTEENKGNINAKVDVGLVESYETFTLIKGKNEENLKAYDGALYICKLKVVNSPEQPKIIFSDHNVLICDKIMPINKVKDPEDVEIGEYDNYYSLKFVNRPDSKSKIDFFDLDILEVIKEKEVYKCEDDFEKLFKEGADLNCEILHLSKYYFTNSEKTYNARVLKAFISEDSDCSKFNLNTEEPHSFNTVLGIGCTDNKDSNNRLEVYIISNWNRIGDNVSATLGFRNKFEKDGDKDIDFHANFSKVNEVNTVFKTFLFIFPYIFVHADRGEQRYPSLYCLDEESPRDYFYNTRILKGKSMQGDAHENLKKYTTYYQGGFACLTSNEEIVLQDHIVSSWDERGIKETCMEVYGNAVYNLLTNCFYLSPDSEQETNYPVDNFVYLEPNYSEFISSIVFKIGIKEKIENKDVDLNDLISINNIVFSTYLNNVLSKFTDIKTELKAKPSVNLKLNSYQGEFPLSLRIDYITPNTEITSNTPVKVKAIPELKEKLQKAANNQPFTSGNIYAYDGESVVLLSDLIKFKIKHVDDKLESIKFRSFNVDSSFISRLKINDDRPLLKESLPGQGTYRLLLNDDNSHTDHLLKNLKSGVTILKANK